MAPNGTHIPVNCSHYNIGVRFYDMVGIRRAIALLLLGFYVTQFAMTAWLGPDEFFPAYFGLTLCYGLAFIGLAAEWFWARWFAIGVGNFGSLMLLALLQVGLEPIVAFFGLTHLAVSLLLTGEGMAAHYEYSEQTNERWNFQEESLVMMRRAVKSAGSTIPILILYTLMPRPELLQWVALGLGVVGLITLLRGRTKGALMLGGAGALALIDLAWNGPSNTTLLIDPYSHTAISGPIFHVFTLGLLLIPAGMARPMLRFLRQR